MHCTRGLDGRQVVNAAWCASDLKRPPLGQRLTTWLADGRPPLAVIVEPRAEILDRWSLPDSPAGALQYVRLLAEAAHGLVALFKIQPAAFERFGPAGWAAIQQAVSVLRGPANGVVVDTKRTDHAPVLRELLRTFVGERSHYAADGLTLLPYLGLPEIIDALPVVAERGGLVFVIARTGNRGAAAVQEARVTAADDATVAAAVVDGVTAQHQATAGVVGLVLGGDLERTARLVECSKGLVILPGWGRPGVDTAAMRRTRDLAPGRVLVSVGSRLSAEGPRTTDLREYLQRQAEALR